MKTCNKCKSAFEGRRCGECNRVYHASYRLANAAKIKATTAAYYLVNATKMKATATAWYRANPGRKSAHNAAWAKAHPEQAKAASAVWAKTHPDKAIASNAIHRAKEAAPKWLTEAHYDEMLAFYTQAKQLELFDGVPRHVDHIVPLQGDNVCGLHVPWNLQILTADQNISKGNR